MLELFGSGRSGQNTIEAGNQALTSGALSDNANELFRGAQLLYDLLDRIPALELVRIIPQTLSVRGVSEYLLVNGRHYFAF